jgi:hypothetical protein
MDDEFMTLMALPFGVLVAAAALLFGPEFWRRYHG